MTAFRILDQSPVFFDLQGRLAAGGSLKFYAAGTTTPKDVYGDEGLTVNNGASIAVGSDGRAADDIWGDGDYRVRLYAADGTLVWDRDDVQIPGGTGTSIPALQSGKFLTNDGANLLWDDILQPPDPTGQSGKVVGSDGANLIWQAAPTAPTIPPIPTDGVTAALGKVTFGKQCIQSGTGTFTATGAQSANTTVTFGTAMASCEAVLIQFTGNNMYLHPRVDTKSGTGFTASCDSNIYGQNINVNQPFVYLAFGTLA
jgi:hypothetical protein